MPSANEFSLSPDANTSIGGIDVSEGCSPAGLNNVNRYLAASMRELSDRVGSTDGSFMPVSGGAFTGNITRDTRGAYLHHNDPANTSARVFVQASGGTAPAMANGDILIEY